MRMMMKVSIPVESGNAAVANGTLGTTIQKILSEVHPEAAYFAAENGERTGYIILDMTDSSQMVQFAEPWFLAFNARIEFQPCMTPQDLGKAAASLENIVKAYFK